MHSVEIILSDFFSNHSVQGKIILALSGGLDSMCLLHAASNVLAEEKLLAVYVNHQLQADADTWEAFCEQHAQQYKIEFHALRIQINRPKANIEAQARQQRYQAIASQMQAEDILVTAHHQDDQAETLLLQLMRGAGVDGLSAMAVVSDFPPGKLVRPWLSVSRKALQDYARINHLQWVNDPSNADDRFNRNFIRNQVLSLLSERWPAVTQMLARSAENLSEAKELVDLQSQTDLSVCLGNYQHSLAIKKLERFSQARQNFLLRQWFLNNGYLAPERDQLNTLLSEIVEARNDASPLLQTVDWQLRRCDG